MSERKVMRPWCEKQGAQSEMVLRSKDSDGIVCRNMYGDYMAQYVCKSCKTHYPWSEAETEQQAIEAAYLAATPPNLPLTDMTTRELCDAMNAAMNLTEAVAVELANRTGLPVKIDVEAGQPADIAAALEAGKGGNT